MKSRCRIVEKSIVVRTKCSFDEARKKNEDSQNKSQKSYIIIINPDVKLCKDLKKNSSTFVLGRRFPLILLEKKRNGF